jgi:crossover junction endodeoxyribonuclease RuvC
MIVLGLDPGTRRCGFAVLLIKNSKFDVMEAGTWKLAEKLSLGKRLEQLHTNARALLERHNPHIIGLEKAVAFKNIPSALTLSEARGILRLAMFQSLEDVEQRLVELSPTQVKRSASGSGRASKSALQKIVNWRFPALQSLDGAAAKNSDTFDAVAIAWTAWIVHNRTYEQQTRP